MSAFRESVREKYRWLRVGEEMLATDVMPDAFGGLIPIREAMVGHKVLGNRYGPDNVLRLRKRKLSTKAKK